MFYPISQLSKSNVSSCNIDGIPGTRGLRGIPGPKGNIGATGSNGLKGDKGNMGLPGPKGSIGIQGIPEISGSKGDKGADALPSGTLVTESSVKIGLRVVRGRDWSWANQDGNPPGKGTITRKNGSTPKYWKVKWDHNGSSNSYRVSNSGKYDLQIA